MKSNAALRLIHLFLLIPLLFSLNCGGGGGSKNLVPTPQPSTPPSITTASLPNGVATKTYTFTLEASGGSGTKSWSIASGALPAGLNLDAASGTISGTPSASGQSSVSFKVQDSGGSATTPSLDLFIDPVLKITTDAQLPNASRGVLYRAPAIMTNTLGGAIRWTILSPALPQGLGLLSDPQNRNQLIFSGIPIQLAANFSFTLQAQDGDVPPQTISKTFTISVTPGLPAAHVPASVPNAIAGTTYSYQFVAVGGTPPYHWTSSPLPPGLNVSPDGVLSGTPGAPSPRFGFSVNVTDSTSAGGLTVPSAITVSPGALVRNDTIDRATTITANGSYQASISPFTDPSSASPDSDYFKLTATPGAIVTITAGNGRQRLNVTIDPVIEIIKDASGARFTTCQNPEDDNPSGKIQPDPTPTAFDDDCLNDDSAPETVDSKLIFQVPNVGTSLTTFYVHVFDWRGDARPDMTCTLTISGLP
jgi:Putative Ig domain